MLFLPLSNAQDAGEYTVTESGDMDADAFADVIVANPDGSITGPITPGEVSVYSGANGSLTVTFKGKKPGDSFGYSVAHTGDYNGDGFFDLLIGSPLEDAGRAYTFFGPFINSGPPLTINADAADLMFISPDADAYDFGDLVAPLTDIDGDGLTDARIRSWFLDAAGLETMRTYIVSGETGMPLFTITGDSPFDPWAFVEGDTDDDGDVDQADLDIIIFNLGLIGAPGSLAVTDGDVDGDGAVTAADLALAMANLGANPFLPLILLTPEAGGGMPGQWVEDWDGTMIWIPDNVVREMRIFLAGGICSLDLAVYADGQKIDPFFPGNYKVDSSSLIRLESPLQAFFEWTWFPHLGREVALELISSNIANPFIFRPQGSGRGTMLGDNDVSPDGVVGNCFEYIILDFVWVDTDSDGMPNGWEIEHGFDPNLDDSTLDADSDGLSNLSEYDYDTDPWNPDTDGDGASDGSEVGWGGNPTNPGDGGVQPAPTDILYVNFCVGDQGFSNGDPDKFSEHWELSFGSAKFRAAPNSPTNPNDIYEFTSCGFAGDLNHANAYRGVWTLENPLPVVRGSTYSISLNWLSTIYSAPDHDWTLTVSVTDANGNAVSPAAGGYILSDPDCLLGTHYNQDPSPCDPASTTQSPIGKTVTFALIEGDLDIFRPNNPFFQILDVPDEVELTSNNPSINAGGGVRFNGDDDNGNQIPDNTESPVLGENDLVKIHLFGEPPEIGQWVLRRSNAFISVWDSPTKTGTELFGANNVAVLPSNTGDFYVEWNNSLTTSATLDFGVRETANDPIIVVDSVLVYRFTSTVVVIGGFNQVPADPVGDPGNHGTFELAIDLFRNGYNVHMYDEDDINWPWGGGTAFENVTNSFNSQNITITSVIGYSHGGGSTYILLDALNLVIPPFAMSVPFSAYIDAVDKPLISPETRLPFMTAYHLNYYQTNPNPGIDLNGGPVTGSFPLPSGLDVSTTAWGLFLNHFTIDDSATVLNAVKAQVELRVPR